MPSCQACQRMLSVLLLVYLGSSSNLVHAQTREQGAEQQTTFHVLYEGPPYQRFDRPLPSVVETSLFREFEDYFNQTLDFEAQGSNTYHPSGRQVVVAIADGHVTGILGDVYDSAGRIFAEFSTSAAGPSLPSERPPCKRFKRLATAIQKYGHMYYHFIQEVLPRIILLQPHMDADTKILSFGSEYEFKWLAELGISADQVEVYNPDLEYCADELVVPSISPIITPPRENYELVRSAFHVDALEQLGEDSNLIIYCSRRDAKERVVANEQALLAAVAQRFPHSSLRVYSGSESVPETIRMFSRAHLVLGMHGAGLAHLVFSPPSVSIVEFLFMPDPPLMFWHAAAALGQHYVMVPLAQSWWLDPHVHVAEQDVIDAIYLTQEPVLGDCPLGQFRLSASGACLPCPAGTYRPDGAATCLPCGAGRVAESASSAFCSTCQAGSFSESGLECVPCGEGEATLFPGAGSKDQCMAADDINAQFDRMFSKDALTEKLVGLPALELPKPQGFWQWVVAMLSPQRWLHLYRYRQLQYRYINELFSSDVHMRDLAPAASTDDAATAATSTAATGPQHRVLQQQQGYGARRRWALGYGSRRQALGYGSRRQAQAVDYKGVRRLLSSAYGARHLMSSMYGTRRSMLGYKRRMRASSSAGSRLSLHALARRLQQSTLHLFTRHSALPGSRVVQHSQGGFWQSCRSFVAWVWRQMRA